MRVIVCGGRDYDNPSLVSHIIDYVWDSMNNYGDLTIATGECQGGADLFARQFAEKMSHWVKYVGYPAEWEAHGKAAGPIRNAHMLSDFKPDLVVAFPGGKGTADMVRKAQEAGVTVMLVGKNFPL